ncbi:hypothetical protein RclHR1_00900001 [Rhizophagus clarus]|uniref:Kinase-like domain-containing protein n=1 Tax=Rhizophagus clarus TaxID=94130 RepID=A0A2Z6SDG0_9GLOM|nr:hypothetical protein RclHR1_00900001 [Rhizophagus clarus]GES73237.1 kinase-like domain-containing protein [Rhizophagus clarus]
MSDDNNSNEWVEWINEAISKQHIKYYNYDHFSNIKVVGTGAFGKVSRANWKHAHRYFALKSFFNLDTTVFKEIVQELKHQREVDFHENIIRFYGIATDKDQNYMLVMEYADSGTLRNFLKEYFSDLNWDDKFNLAIQLAYAVTCLHDEGIVHRDLHSGNILVHQKSIIKLADFGLSKRIEEASIVNSRIFGMIPYIDPKRFDRQRNDKNQTQIYSLNEKSDVYSVGVLFWEISSGMVPFHNEPHDISLIMGISQGFREKPVPDTPVDYIKLYTDCWNGEPDKRPAMNQVIDQLKLLISPETIENDQTNNSEDITHNNTTASHEQKPFNSDNIKNSDASFTGFSNLVTAELVECLNVPSNNIMNDGILKNIFMRLNEGKDLKEDILDDCYIDSKEIYDWLINNQNDSDSNSIFLLGNFNYLGIGTQINKENAFKLYEKAANLGNSIAQYNLAQMYKTGEGVNIDYEKAFKLFEESFRGEYLNGIFMLGYCYSNGIGTSVDGHKAFELYEKAANLGHNVALRNLALMFKKGEIIDKNYDKASELFKKLYKKYLFRNNNEYSFLHNSLLEYFVARAIYEDISESEEIQQEFLKVDVIVNKLKPLGEQSVIQFLAERIQEETAFKNQLYEFIKCSKTDESFQNVAANAITVLVKAGVQFKGADLNGIRIPGADLSYGMFDHAQFQGADLRNVYLLGAWLQEANFNHANMTGIEFGETPFLVLKNMDTIYHKADHDGISCCYSQDEKFLVGAIRDTIILYNTETFEEIWRSYGELDSYINVPDLSWKASVSISPNGSLIAMGRWNYTISLWANKDESLAYEKFADFREHTDKILSVSISPNSKYVVSGSSDCTICLWIVREKRLLHRFKEHKGGVNSVSFSPDSSLIVSGSEDNMVYIWSVNEKKLLYVFEGHRASVRSVSFSPNNEFIISGTKDGMIYLWSTKERKLLYTFKAHRNEIVSTLFSPNGELIISGGWDCAVRLWSWSVKEAKLLHVFYGHTDRVTSVSSNSKCIASGGIDGKIRLWSIKNKEKFTHSLGRVLINDELFSPNEEWIVDSFGILRGPHLAEWPAFSPDGKFIALAKDNFINLFSKENKDPFFTFEVEESSEWKFNCISISPNSEFIAAGPWIEGGYSGNYYGIKLFSVKERELIHTFQGHEWQVNCVSFSPNGELLASGSWDDTARLWSLKEKKLLATFDHRKFIGHDRPCIECISFSPDSEFIVTGGWNYTVTLWSIKDSKKPQKIFDEHKNIICDVKFSPDGKLIASASRDCTVRIWSTSSGNKSLAVIRGFIGCVSHIAWNKTEEGLFLHTINSENDMDNGNKFHRYWQIEQNDHKLQVKLRWVPYQSALTTYNAHIQNVNGLSPMNEKLLIQYGATRK